MVSKDKIKFDFSLAVKEHSIEKYRPLVEKISNKLKKSDVEYHQFLGSFKIKRNQQKNQIDLIKELPKKLLSENIDTLVIIAPQHVCLQAQALTNLVNGKYPESSSKKLDLIFVNETINGRDIAQLIRLLETRNFAINVISQNGESFEILLIFRELKLLLTKAVGSANAAKYIYITTNNNYGKLFNEVQVNKYNHLILLDNSTEKFFSYSAAILLPLACSGVDIDEYLEGAIEANEYYENADLKNNSAYQYAIVRFILWDNLYRLEHLNYYSNSEAKLSNLFKMYLTEGSLRKNKGIIVMSNQQPADLNSYSENQVNSFIKTFETSIICENPKIDYSISLSHENDDDYYNYLYNFTYNKIGKIINNTLIDNHVNNFKIPNLKIIIENYDYRTLGWIIAFIQWSTLMCANLLEINPFDNVGVKSYHVELIKNITELAGGSKND
ncbi:glucose-6-phosphate isomerase [Metamycoplasma spumans]|uniref:hypothetical protein n=1 Tax=Metamycoplasma spumans TaxID=92406 RepID=UPI000485B4A3